MWEALHLPEKHRWARRSTAPAHSNPGQPPRAPRSWHAPVHIQRRCDTRAMQALECPTAAFFTLQVVEVGDQAGNGNRIATGGRKPVRPTPAAAASMRALAIMNGSQAHNCDLHSQSGSRVRLVQNQAVPLDRAQRREVGPGPAVLLAAVVGAQRGVRGHHLQ